MIRKADINDLVTLNHLLQDIDKNEKVFEDTLEHPFFNYIVYVSDDTVVGFLKYSLIYDRIEIDYVYVLPEYRENKIATKLIENVVMECENKEISNISLEVRKSNDAARRLYEKLGFKEIAVRKKYYGNEDGLVYMRGE